jgi:DmsE family decaheme c-type cytochrome
MPNEAGGASIVNSKFASGGPRFVAYFFLLLILLLPAASAVAQLEGEYSRRGGSECLRCHGEKSDWNVVGIFRNKHGSRVDPDAPFGNLQCEACHGPGAAHIDAMKDKGELEPGQIIRFGTDVDTPASQQNEMCLGCHESHGLVGWFGSAHEEQEVPCAACHNPHAEREPMFDAFQQQEICFECHQQYRGQTLLPSNHPLRFGKMTCSDCHNTHNGHNDYLLTQTTTNETCYTCHAELRGPFLWEHAPVAEDCSNCHRPHGSNHAGMLTQRQPLLCQQCHMPSGHPSLALTSESANDFYEQRFLLATSCGNCHAQPHGSNHPSGVWLGR